MPPPEQPPKRPLSITVHKGRPLLTLPKPTQGEPLTSDEPTKVFRDPILSSFVKPGEPVTSATSPFDNLADAGFSEQDIPLVQKLVAYFNKSRQKFSLPIASTSKEKPPAKKSKPPSAAAGRAPDPSSSSEEESEEDEDEEEEVEEPVHKKRRSSHPKSNKNKHDESDTDESSTVQKQRKFIYKALNK